MPAPHKSPSHATHPNVVRDLVRQVDALDLRIQGLSYQEIGERLGIERTTAWQQVKNGLEKLTEESLAKAEELRAMEIARLDKIAAPMMEKVDKADPKVAMALVKIAERRAKLLGLDAPETVEHKGLLGVAVALANNPQALHARFIALLEKETPGIDPGEVSSTDET